MPPLPMAQMSYNLASSLRELQLVSPQQERTRSFDPGPFDFIARDDDEEDWMDGERDPRGVPEVRLRPEDRLLVLEALLDDDGEARTPSSRRMRRLAGVKSMLGLRERLVAGFRGLARDVVSSAAM